MIEFFMNHIAVTIAVAVVEYGAFFVACKTGLTQKFMLRLFNIVFGE